MKLLDLFAGTGVGVAASQLGVVEYGVEIMPEAIATRDAAGFITPYTDVWDIEKAADLDFDSLWASPPCQTFSVAGGGSGRRALDDVVRGIREERWKGIESLKELGEEVGDDRTALVLTPLAYIQRFLPTHVALEQVPTVLPVWEAYREPLEALGYSVWTGFLNSEQYGVPQTRKRAYLIARRDGRVATPPKPTHSRYYSRSPERLDPGVEKWVSMYDALAWGTPVRPYFTVASGHLDAAFLGGTGARDGLRALSELPDWTHRRPATTVVGSFRPDVISAPGYRKKGDPSRQNAPGSVVVTELEASVLQGYPRAWGFTSRPHPSLTSHLGVTRSPSGTQEVYQKAIDAGDFIFRQDDAPASTRASSGIGSRYSPGAVNLEDADGGVVAGYPQGFPFQGSKTKRHLQIGNAVPPPVAKAVLETFL